MTERIICNEFDEANKAQISLDAFISKTLDYVDRFLKLIDTHDESIVKKLLEKYKNDLVAMNIATEPNNEVQKYNNDYSKYKMLQKHPEYIPIMENAVLHFLNFQKYEAIYTQGEKFEVLFTDRIRADFFVVYYLAYALIEFLSRETVLELAKEWTDKMYASIQDQITKHETIEDMFESYHGKGCWKTHNLVAQVIDGRYYDKTTRCVWAEVYAELPDLKLASLLECHGDFSKMQYINPNFALSRTKTLVEGHDCCDFVNYDKRKEKEIEHPDEDFWKEFK